MASAILASDNRRLPLVAHVIQRLAVGGLENGVFNLINHMPGNRYRHAIICLADATDYAQRICRNDAQVIELHQRKGRDVSVHGRFFRVLRHLRRAIVHTRNLPALEFQATAAMAGVQCRVHGEHGREIYDLDGRNFKYNTLRRLMRPFIHRYIAVSQNLSKWLVHEIKVPAKRVAQIYNGVDTEKFHPSTFLEPAQIPEYIRSTETFVVGTVGRMETVKDQLILVRAFLLLLNEESTVGKRLRLILIGDGPLREQARELLRSAGAARLAWLPGERNDIPDIMRAMDLFVLPSLREGISNTILEAMASGLSVVATAVGGNPEVVERGIKGLLVPPSDPVAMAKAIRFYFDRSDSRMEHGAAGRKRVESRFSMEAMVEGYLKVYDAVLNRTRREAAADWDGVARSSQP